MAYLSQNIKCVGNLGAKPVKQRRKRPISIYKMKIAMITYGSRGDVQPMLALAVALQKAGHTVTLAAPPENAAWAINCGQRFQPFGSPLTAYIDRFKNAHSISAMAHFLKFLHHEINLQFAQSPAIVADADLVIGASLVVAVPSVAEYMNVPYRFLAFCPQIIPSAHHPYPPITFQRLPAVLNRFSWRFKEWTDGALMRTPINRRRRQLGLSPVKSVWDHLLGRDVLVASDPGLAAVPADVKLNTAQCGHLHLDQRRRRDQLLQDYINAGSPPVFIGFGSMPRKDSRRLLELFRRATGLNGSRALIYMRGQPQARILADDCCTVGDVVHAHILPRCAAMVHHGGAGTTAAAARAGIPQIIVAHMLDQFYWAHRIHRLGLGPRAISRRRLSAKALGRAISACLHETDLHARCRQTAARIRPQDSLAQAVAWVEAAEFQPAPGKWVYPTAGYDILGT